MNTYPSTHNPAEQKQYWGAEPRALALTSIPVRYLTPRPDKEFESVFARLDANNFIHYVSRFWSLFYLYHVPQFHVSTVVPRSTLHHWSTPHRCHPTYTIHSHIQYQLSSILQFFLHTRCFPTATLRELYEPELQYAKHFLFYAGNCIGA
jgi:hypothetical protein